MEQGPKTTATKLSSTQKIKNMVKLYGGLGIATHTVLSLTSLGCTYALVSYGIDVQNLVYKLGFNVKLGDNQQMMSDFALAYVVHKATMPIRVPITLGVVPIVAKILKRGK
ncbi:hypothetical protein PPERSA_04239 [Pseudocohnilembus persalinus]|uniref:DUF1279 domain-containing protein n=1 Tax=Pseudocohnilembus persalinus TaxID=266149 RepID=A0A0V0QN02_PSEPJ|nr:hypothetical protein PPERSA_04239 [Pseudocohnilembus persalinus]|eukprot:KRX03731.1 hypothetical protein PPERSA_04239 [Pseudocohnilembus persalinus]